MRMTIDIDRELLLEARRILGAKTFKETVALVLQYTIDHPDHFRPIKNDAKKK
jgi:Arc/MetJ family transcription regulator